MVAALEGDQSKGLFEIWPENEDIVDAFLAVSTQWRTTALADGRVYWMGLDYAGVQAGLACAAIKLSPDHWSGLRIMETAARDSLNGVRG